MSLSPALLLIYVLAPFLAAVIPWGKSLRGGLITPGSVASFLRLLLLFFLSRAVISDGESVSLRGTLVNGYPLDIVLSLDSYRYGFLLTAEFCFLFAHWMSSPRAPHGTLVRILICLAQGLSSVFFISNNSVATGGLLMLAGAVFFYLVRFSVEGPKENLSASISRRMYVLFFLLGLMMVAWGIMEFGGKDLLFAKAGAPKFGSVVWLALLVLTVPIPPWSRWFSQAIEHLPEGVTLALVTFMSGVTLKFATLFSVVYPDLAWKQKLGIYALGILGCGFSLSKLFSAGSRRRMLGSLPSFFFCLILVSVGVSRSNLVISAYFTCLFVPVFTGLVLYASTVQLSSPTQKAFVGLLLAVILGLPGTPVFLIFSAIGARSLDLGISYMLLFTLLWFFYFSANVFICRKIFMDRDPVESLSPSGLDDAPISFAGYGLFLMIFVIFVTQAAWRIL
jgi:hypothetical protein